MIKPLLPAAPLLLLLAVPANSAAPAPAVVPLAELSAAVRCSALFGIVAGEQARGVADAQRFPPLAERGREFFVITGARLMDAEGLDRAAMQSRMQAEVARIQAESAAAPDARGFVDAAMQPCVALLNATIPARLPPPR
ncbi:hypothetical protein [Novosphingobium sp.]|uniref:hypothetical protein n=1 Tax=Novosphingobium sp. TaxID=1874826 RepID=UPI00273341B8|nr:hypothetical protein [Novosphingobium sp.]MDP3908497.1 hypothetical protein [Novosphingobium sp.]